MIDFDRLRERLERNPRARLVITTARPVQQEDESWRYPILIINKVLPEERAVLTDTEDGSGRLLTEEDLQEYFPVGVSLYHKDKIIREGRGVSTTNTDSTALQFLLAICQEAGKEDPSIRTFLQEIEKKDLTDYELRQGLAVMAHALKNPELAKKAKSFLQDTIEMRTRVHPSMMQYKQQYREPTKKVRGS